MRLLSSPSGITINEGANGPSCVCEWASAQFSARNWLVEYPGRSARSGRSGNSLAKLDQIAMRQQLRQNSPICLDSQQLSYYIMELALNS